MYRNVMWDMGGTLVNTYPALDRTLAEVVAAHHHSITVDDVARLTRQSTAKAVSSLSERFSIAEGEFTAAIADLNRLWETHPAPAMAGARKLMLDVHAAGGLNLVVTHRDRVSAENLLGGLGLKVDDLISTADGFPRKPDPSMYLALVERHGLDPESCLAVGDRPIDAAAAQAAGIAAATVESPLAPVDDGAEYSVATLDELRQYLGLPTLSQQAQTARLS